MHHCLPLCCDLPPTALTYPSLNPTLLQHSRAHGSSPACLPGPVIAVAGRYTYGPVILARAAYAGSYQLAYETGYSKSTVSVFQDSVSIGSSGSTGTFGISLTGGTKSVLSLQVLNGDSGITLTYDLIVIRPLPLCADSQLTQW